MCSLDVTDAIAHNAPQDHIDYPSDKCSEERKEGRNGHENCAGAVV